MSERVATWRIVADYSRARREAKKTAAELRRLDRVRENLDEGTVEGNEEVVATNKDRAKSIMSTMAAMRRQAAQQIQTNRATESATRAERDLVAATEKSTQAAERQTDTNRRLLDTVRRLGQERGKHARASRDEVVQTEAVVRANTRLQRALISRNQATSALSQAQARLAAAEARHGQSSAQYERALFSVQRRMLDAQSAAHRYAQAQNVVSAAQRQAASSGSGFIGNIGRMTGAFIAGAGAARGFGLALGLIKVTAVVYGIGALVSALSSLTAGLIAVVGPILNTVNALAALPQALTVVAGSIGTVIGAFAGLGEAVKAGAEAQKSAGKEAKALGRAERDSARQIAAAQRAVKQARQNAADTRRSNAQAIRSAIDAEKDAEENLADAIERTAQARKDAAQQIRDYQRALEDLELQERGASLSLEEARRRLDETLIDPGADDLAKRQAELAYDEAYARLNDVRREQKATQKEAKAARAKGVNGSEIVIDALEAERDALEAVREAERGVSEARRSARRSAQAAGQAIKDAQQGVTDAVEASSEAMEGAADASTKYKESLEDLSPEAKAFVTLLLSMRGHLTTLRQAAQRGLLPGVGASLVEMTKLMPIAERGLESFGRIMGGALLRMSKTATSPSFIPMWNRLLTSNEKILRSGGRATHNMMVAVVNLMDAARPFTEWLFKSVEGWTKYWAEISKAGNETGRTAGHLEKTKQVLQTLSGTFKNLWGTFKNIFGAGSELGMDLLRSMERITGAWEKWTGSVEGKKQLKEWFDAARPVLHETSELLGALMRMFFDMGRENNIAPIIRAIRIQLLPALERLLTSLSGDFAQSLIDALEEVMNLFADLTEGGGGLSVFFDVIGGVADVLNSFPTPVLKTIVGLLASLAAMRFLGMVTGINALVGGGARLGKAANGFRKERQRRTAAAQELRQAQSEATRAGAGGTVVATGGGRGRHAARKPNVRQRLRDRAGQVRGRVRERMSQRNEGGFMALGGGGKKEPRKTPTRRSGGSAAGGDTRAANKAAGGAQKASNKAAGSVRKFGGAAAGAAGVVSTLVMALGFLPGPIGEAAAKFGNIALVVAMVAPLLSSLGGAFMRVVSVLGGVITKIGGFMLKLLGIVSKAMMVLGKIMLANPWMLLIAALVVIIVLIVKHWDKIKKVVLKAIDVLKKAMKASWEKIKDIFTGVWDWVKRKAEEFWNRLKLAFILGAALVRIGFKTAWNKIKDVFSGVWTWVKDKASDFWDGMKTLFTRGADGVKTIFKNLKTGIKEVWDKIKTVVSKPVEFIVNRVINDGIIKNYNKLADLLPGIGPIKEVSFKGFKKGGIPNAKDMDVYPGYTPGRDVGFIGISGGEAIMRPEWTRAIGTAQINEWNKAARTGGVSAVARKLHGNPKKDKRYKGGFASGGVNPLPGGALTNRHPTPYYGAWFAGDYNKPGNDYGARIAAWKKGRVAYVKSMKGSYGNHAEINHDDNNRTLYAHMSRVAVRGGQEVRAGQTVGYVGSTGNSTGPHLHFEISGGQADQIFGSFASGGSSSGGGIELPGWAKPIVNRTANWVKEKVYGGIDKLSGKFGDSPFIKMVAGIPKKLIGGFVEFIKGETADVQAVDFGRISGITSGVAQTIVRAMAKEQFGWGSREWPALHELVQRESGWDPNAANPNSSARGLFQKMTSLHGPVEGTVAGQARWGLNYIKNEYGTPSKALAFHNSRGWYANGGVVPDAGAANGAPVQKFARGGRVRGFGNRDTVPAMLTPGEYVVNRDAVDRIGVSNLERANHSKSGARGRASGVQYFHKGGPVLGMQQGVEAKWVKALQFMLGWNDLDGEWDSRLTERLKGVQNAAALSGPQFDPRKGAGLLRYLGLPDSVAGTGGVVRTGTYNLKHATALGRNKDDLRRIAQMTDVLSLQEMMFEKGNKVKSFLQDMGWGVYYPKTKGLTGGLTDETAIAWNNSKYEAEKKGFRVLNRKHTGGYKKPTKRIAPYVLLRDRETGKKFWQVSAHTVVHGYKKKANRPEMLEQFANLRKLYGDLSKSAPVVMAGDFNNPKMVRDLKIPGLKRSQPKGIDAVLTGAGTKIINKGQIAGQGYGGGKYKPGRMGSDHPYVWANLLLPGAQRTGGGKKAKKVKPKDHTFAEAMLRLGVGQTELMGLARNENVRAILSAYGAQIPKFMKGFRPRDKSVAESVTALNEKMNVRPKDGLTANTRKAAFHAIAHALGKEHDDFEARPWQSWTPLEASIIQAEARNKKLIEWQGYLEQIATWGFESLLNNLFEQGIDGEGALETAKGAAGNKSLASRLNEVLKARGNLSDEDIQRLIRMVAFLNSQGTSPGLRDTARHLGLSDYETVRLYDQGITTGRVSSVPMTRRARMEDDIRKYREGTYYFSGGGPVPGAGNRDSVPAMLTPGEFVLKRQAAKMLGLDNLWALNNPERFAAGGLVMAPGVSYAPTRTDAGVSARRLATMASGGITYQNVYDVDIHNPIAERGTRSMMKALQRQSVFKTGGSTVTTRG